ncbi:signal peptidase I [Candidatus Sumerlaeota bacterium]|nr:signal peptidase I [Candidatus Sumerlaeota bacterium]
MTPDLSVNPAEQTPNRDEYDHQGGVMTIIREWMDALIIAFILAMFVRVFVVELFKIPTGSMTPTLIGDFVAEEDVDGDGRKDLIVRGQSQILVFADKGERYEYDDKLTESLPRKYNVDQWIRDGFFQPEYDRILVNKFAYWLGNPDRGDVVVFKVPEAIWDPAKPIYIKRAVGLPGDRISFNGRLKSDGKEINSPEFFQHQAYVDTVQTNYSGYARQDFVRYQINGMSRLKIEEVHVPDEGLYVMGDNTHSSLDSRYWGIVPLQNLKGKAFFRYWPLKKIKFIR